MRVSVKGGEQLTRIADVLTEKGNSPALKRRTTKALNAGADPIKRDQRASLAAGLPKRGGAALTVSSETTISIRTSYVRATVDIVDSWKGHNLPAIDRGILRHPLFGNRGHWFTTSVPPGMLTNPFIRHKRTVQLALFVEMQKLAEEIARET